MKQQIELTIKEQVYVAQAIDDRIEVLRERLLNTEASFIYARAIEDQIDALLDVKDRLIKEE